MPAKFGFPVFDCDGHITEPLAIWNEYLDPKYRAAAREHFTIENTPQGAHWVVEEFFGPPGSGGAYLPAQQQVPGLPAGVFGTFCRAGAYRPGRTVKKISEIPTAGLMWGPDGDYMNPGGFDPHARIKDMDLEGIDKAAIIPTFFAMAPGIRDPQLANALCRAYNDWAWDYCRPYPDRLYPLAMAPVQDIALAKTELKRCAKKGFRIAAARPNPMAGHLLHEPYFFPLWEVLNEARIPVVFHPFPSPELEGGHEFLAKMGAGGLMETLSFTLDNMVTLANLMFHGILDKYRNVRLAFIESSCTWVFGVLDRLDKRYYLWRDQFPGLKSMPTELFQRQCFISFEAAERAVPFVTKLAPDNILWASDYPHHDADPPGPAVDWMCTQGLSPELQAKVMGGNASRFFGIPLN